MDKYSLPGWMQWLQALAIILLSGLGAWIAFKQVRIAYAKLSFDLYEKRFAVFEAAQKLLIAILQNADVTDRDLSEYNLEVIDAGFLFDQEIEDYLDDLRKRAARLGAISELLPRV